MRKDQEDEDWEAQAQAGFAQEAESEFKRLKEGLKRKAGLVPLPLYRRVLNAAMRLIRRLMRKHNGSA